VAGADDVSRSAEGQLHAIQTVLARGLNLAVLQTASLTWMSVFDDWMYTLCTTTEVGGKPLDNNSIHIVYVSAMVFRGGLLAKY